MHRPGAQRIHGAARARWPAAALVVVVGALLAACADPGLAQMEDVRASVCRCKNASCVDAALARLPAAAPKELRRARALAAAMQRCIAELAETTQTTQTTQTTPDP
jgi:hypothetical protein